MCGVVECVCICDHCVRRCVFVQLFSDLFVCVCVK